MPSRAAVFSEYKAWSERRLEEGERPIFVLSVYKAGRQYRFQFVCADGRLRNDGWTRGPALSLDETLPGIFNVTRIQLAKERTGHSKDTQ